MDSSFIKIKGFEKYLINPQGIIYTEKSKKLRKSVKLKSGYVTILLRNNNKSYLKTVHRLVALAFIPNPENKCCVNHKDGDRTNNNIENLEWVTYRENMIHAIKFLGRKGSKILTGKNGALSPLSQIICQISPDGFLIAVFIGIREASRQTNIPKSTILKCRAGKTNYAGGYIWL